MLLFIEQFGVNVELWFQVSSTTTYSPFLNMVEGYSLKLYMWLIRINTKLRDALREYVPRTPSILKQVFTNGFGTNVWQAKRGYKVYLAYN